MSSIIATTIGLSPSITLNTGDWVLQFTSDGDFELDVQVGDHNGMYNLYYGSGNKVTINSRHGTRHIVVVGEMSYRMNVITYNNPITMRVVKVS
jgi:hypothetical protein